MQKVGHSRNCNKINKQDEVDNDSTTIKSREKRILKKILNTKATVLK